MNTNTEDATADLARLESMRPADVSRAEWVARLVVIMRAVRDRPGCGCWYFDGGEWVPALVMKREIRDGREVVGVDTFDGAGVRWVEAGAVRGFSEDAPAAPDLGTVER